MSDYNEWFDPNIKRSLFTQTLPEVECTNTVFSDIGHSNSSKKVSKLVDNQIKGQSFVFLGQNLNKFEYEKLLEQHLKKDDITSAIECLKKIRGQGKFAEQSSYLQLLKWLSDHESSYGLDYLEHEILNTSLISSYVILNALLHACSVVNDQDKITHISDLIETGKIRPHVNLFTILLNNAVNLNNIKSAEDIMRRMKSWDIEPNIVTFSTLLRGYALSKFPKGAEGVLLRMEKANINPSLITFTTLLKLYADMDDEKGIQHTIQRMNDKSIDLGEYSYSILLHRCIKKNDVTGIAKIRHLMTQAGLKQSIFTYTSLLKLYYIDKNYLKIDSFLEEIEESGVAYSLIFFSSLIDLHVEKNDHARLNLALEKMADEKIKGNERIFTTLLKYYAAQELFDDAWNLYTSALKTLKSVTSLTMYMIDLLVRLDKLDDARKLYSERLPLDLELYNRSFAVQDTLHGFSFDCHNKTFGFCLLALESYLKEILDGTRKSSLTIITGIGEGHQKVQDSKKILFDMRNALRNWIHHLYPKLQVKVDRTNVGCLLVSI